jgi:hypothetical protein
MHRIIVEGIIHGSLGSFYILLGKLRVTFHTPLTLQPDHLVRVQVQVEAMGEDWIEGRMEYMEAET